MIGFIADHAPLILKKRKTQTRRMGKKRWNIGAIHQCYVGSPRTGREPFARVRITAVRQERLGDISHEDTLREGYQGIQKYMEAFGRINHLPWTVEVLQRPVWVVDFELVEPDRLNRSIAAAQPQGERS